MWHKWILLWVLISLLLSCGDKEEEEGQKEEIDKPTKPSFRKEVRLVPPIILGRLLPDQIKSYHLVQDRSSFRKMEGGIKSEVIGTYLDNDNNSFSMVVEDYGNQKENAIKIHPWIDGGENDNANYKQEDLKDLAGKDYPAVSGYEHDTEFLKVWVSDRYLFQIRKDLKGKSLFGQEEDLFKAELIHSEDQPKPSSSLSLKETAGSIQLDKIKQAEAYQSSYEGKETYADLAKADCGKDDPRHLLEERVLKKILPTSVGGSWQSEIKSGDKMDVWFGPKYALAHYGTPKIQVQIVDFLNLDSQPAVSMLQQIGMSWVTQEVFEQTPTGERKTTDFYGFRALEWHDSKLAKRGFYVSIAKRFLVLIEADIAASKEKLNTAFWRVNLADLSNMCVEKEGSELENESFYLQMVTRCAMGLGAGVKEGIPTISEFIDGVASFSKLVWQGAKYVIKLGVDWMMTFHPNDTIKELAEEELANKFNNAKTEVLGAIKTLAQAILTIDKYLERKSDWFVQLPVHQRAEAVCKIAGQMGFEVLFTVSGIKAPHLLSQMPKAMEIIQKVKKTTPKTEAKDWSSENNMPKHPELEEAIQKETSDLHTRHNQQIHEDYKKQQAGKLTAFKQDLKDFVKENDIKSSSKGTMAIRGSVLDTYLNGIGKNTVEVLHVSPGSSTSHLALRIGDRVYHTSFGKKIDKKGEDFKEVIKGYQEQNREIHGFAFEASEAEKAKMLGYFDKHNGKEYGYSEIVFGNCSQNVCRAVKEADLKSVPEGISIDPQVAMSWFEKNKNNRFAISTNYDENPSTRRFLLKAPNNGFYALIGMTGVLTYIGTE